MQESIFANKSRPPSNSISNTNKSMIQQIATSIPEASKSRLREKVRRRSFNGKPPAVRTRGAVGEDAGRTINKGD